MTVSNRLDKLFTKKKNLLTIYLTAGFPNLDDTIPLCRAVEQAGADIIEVGVPFSDPISDGPVIQQASERAIKNGMTVQLLFSQLERLRDSVAAPVLLMGYLNPVLQYGIERFCTDCERVGIDGVILPDLPLAEFLSSYKETFVSHNLHNILLITETTAEERIRLIDSHSSGFIYAVSAAGTTGTAITFDQKREEYFQRLSSMNLTTPVQIGFGITDRKAFDNACRYASGGIIGSAFLKVIEQESEPLVAAAEFVRKFR